MKKNNLINLIVATALPVLNTHYSKNLNFNNNHISFYTCLHPNLLVVGGVREYSTDNCNNNIVPDLLEGEDSNNNNSNIIKNDDINIENTRVPSLDDLLKFKEEIKKIREKDFDDLNNNQEARELNDWDIDDLGFIYHSTSKESSSFDESFPNYNKEKDELENILNQVNSVNKILGNKKILELFKERFNSESLDNNISSPPVFEWGEDINKRIDEISKSNEILNTVINNNNNTGFMIFKWKENNKLNIEVDLEKSKDIYNNTISVLKHLNLDTVDFSGKFIPFTGWMLAHRSFMNIFHKHLNRNLTNKSPQEILRFKNKNFRSLALIHILSLFCTGLITLGFGHAIKSNTNLPILAQIDSSSDSINPILETNKDSSSNSNIVKSILPMFIINKFNKLTKIYSSCSSANAKAKIANYFTSITISILIYIIFYILTNYFPDILEYIYFYFNYKTIGYLSIFVMFYIIYTLFELIIIYYFVQYKDSIKLLENSFYLKLPKYIKKDIISFRENEKAEDKDFFNKQYIFYILIHLISLIICFIIIIICLIIL